MESMIRDTLRGIRPYAPVDAGSAVDLSDNTSLWGPPPAALSAIRALDAGALARYPNLQPRSLGRAVATYVGVPDERVVVGCGSDDLIDCAMRAFAAPGDTIAVATPTFSMVPAYAAINGLRVHGVPLDRNFDMDADALLAPNPRLVYLCSPNNPTATRLPVATIERVLTRATGVVVLDEAYAEFTDPPGIALTRRFDRLVVMRTLSKAFGLAGLRVGYAVLAPELGRALEVARGPYKVSAPAAAAAVAALTDGAAWVRERAAEAVELRTRVVVRLRELGWSPLPSAANFLCLPCADAPIVAESLRRRGLAVRVFSGIPPMTPALEQSGGQVLRFTIGPWPVMEQLIAALQAEGRPCA